MSDYVEKKREYQILMMPRYRNAICKATLHIADL